MGVRTLGWTAALAVVIATAAPAQNYVDVAGDVGLVLSHDLGELCPPPLGSGAAWADYDADSDIDLFVTNRGGANRLYRNDGDTDLDGLPDFTDVAGQPGFPVDDPTGFGHSAVFIDYDNDGDQDLYVTNWDGNNLYQNQLTESGSVSFVDVTGVAGLADGGRAITTAWGDYDNDGFLDVYLARHRRCGGDDDNQDHLYRNLGDGSFADVTDLLCPGTAPCDAVLGLGFAPGFVDYDNDGDLDLYLVNDNIQSRYSPNVLWRNDGPDGSSWLFTDVSAASGTDVSLNGMGLGIGDYDNDGFFDFAFTNIGNNVLLRNLGNGTFSDESEIAGIERGILPSGFLSVTWGAAFFDYDNDALLDLFFVAGYLGDGAATQIQPNAFFENNGDLTFTDVSAASGLDTTGRGRAGAVADFDQDGWVDVFIGNLGQAPNLMHNRTAELGISNNWLTVTAEGTVSNRDAIGTRIWLTTDDATQMREINSGPTHGGGDYRAAYFGLAGAAEGALRVRWPSGVDQDLGTVAANQQLHLVEPLDARVTKGAIVNGRRTGGGIGALRESDDNYVSIASELFGSFQETMMEVIINPRRTSISRLDVKLERNVDVDNLETAVYAYDYDTDRWVSLGKRFLPSGGDVISLYLDVPNADAFVNADTQRMKLRFRSRAAVAHSIQFDHVQVLTYENN